jgi:hypothetical protein
VHGVGENDPGVDVKRCAGAHSPNHIAQRVDIHNQQVRAPIQQVYGTEEGPAWNPIAAIIRHPRSVHGRGERRNALRCSALRLLEDVAVLDNLHAILSVPGIDLYSIGPNDFAQSLGYPGQPNHPEVVKPMHEITRRIRQAGRRMQLDVMQGAWVSAMPLDAGRRILSSQHG